MIYKTSVILCVLMLLLGTANSNAQFAGGSGTADAPWEVATLQHLNNVRNYLGEDHADKHFIQTADIDAAGNTWEPIGSRSAKFMGTYHGNDFTISNITIYRPEADDNGLFGYLEGARVSNLNITDIQINGSRYSGGLAGRVHSSVLSFISVTGSIVGYDDDTGGVIGLVRNSSQLSWLSADVTVVGREATGGLIGRQWTSEVRYSYAKGTVTGMSLTGGLIGYTSSLVADSYTTADVTGTSSVGGFTGSNWGGSVHRSYSTGAVAGESNVGGFAGRSDSYSQTAYSFWNTETSGQETSAGGSGVNGLTTAELKQQSTFAAFNFYSAWQISEGSGYPEFQDFSVYTLPEYTELENLSGSGTEHDPYIISTIHELNAVRQDVTAHYRLAENLDLKPSVVWNMGQGWEPFGDASNWFAGVFDGNGKIITGLAVNRPGTNNQGLFGYLREAEVADVNLADVQVYGMRYTGGLAGTAHSSHLSIISVTGNIAGHDDDTGGVIGLVRNNSMLSRLSADVNVMGRDATGGLIGRQWTSEVRYSYAKGTVTGMSLTGGLTGYTSSLVADSYTTADVTGTTSVGGFTGSNWGGTVHRSYSTGAVVGESNVGGFAGRSDVYSEALNSFWNTETSGQETSAGGSGVTGLTTADMTFPYATGVYAEWDFDTIWSHDEDHSVNAGYPHIDEGLPTSAENETDVPRIVKLHQNYPNPFNPITNISYELPQQQEVRLEVYNVLGRRVAVLVSGTQPAGYYTIQFDASRLASGMYLYRLQAGSVVQTHKMMLVR